MNLAELIHAISTQTQVSQKQVDAILNATFDTIVEAVAAGNKVARARFRFF